MNPTERNYILYLEDIVESMKRIQEYIANLEFADFKKDYKTVDAVVRNFEIVGEAAKNIPDQMKTQYSEVPWNEMYRLRNRVSHEYFGIDYEIIWDIAKNYLPKNYEDICIILSVERSKKESLG